MNNGTRKGGQPDAMTVLSSPETAGSLADPLLTAEWTGIHGAALFIANGVDEQPASLPVAAGAARPGPRLATAARPQRDAYWIKVTASDDGWFTVTNARNGFTKTYAAR